jgi:hypothetical protein
LSEAQLGWYVCATEVMVANKQNSRKSFFMHLSNEINHT